MDSVSTIDSYSPTLKKEKEGEMWGVKSFSSTA